MTKGLPDDLVRSKNPYTEEDGQPVPREDLLRLWRAYSVSKRAMSSNVGLRLEHFFWRILGSQGLQESLTGRQIAILHAVIIQNEDIRTTPKTSPAKSQNGSNRDARFPNQAGDNSRNAPNSSNLSPLQAGENSHRRAFVQTGRDRSTSRPRPILRVPGIEAASTSKSARILTPTWGKNPSDKATLAQEPTTDPLATISNQLQSTQQPIFRTRTIDFATASRGSLAISPTGISPKSTKKPPSFAVPSKKRRPSMPSRRSSQSSSASNIKSPRNTTSLSVTPEHCPTPATPRAQSYQSTNSTQLRGSISGDAASITSSSTTSTTTQIPRPTRTGSESGLRFFAGAGATAAAGLSATGSRTPNIPKSTLTTGLSTSDAIVASLQPFADQDAEPETGVRRASVAEGATSSGMPVLPSRSMSQLNLLLARDKRRGSQDPRSG